MPNPANNKFEVVLTGDNTDVRVFDMLGKQIYYQLLNTGKHEISSSDWIAGDYIIAFVKDGYIETRKIAITK